VNWNDVPETTVKFAWRSLAAATRLREATSGLLPVRHHVLFQPDADALHVGLAKSASDQQVAAWEGALRDRFESVAVAPMDVQPVGFGKDPWVWIKQAADPVVSTAAKLLNYQPSAINALIGGPSPLAAALTSGLVGAGLGYAGGALAEKLLPAADFNEGVLRRNTAIAGGLAGAAPALLWGITAHQKHPDTPGWRAWLSSWPFRRQDMRETIKTALERARCDLDALEKDAFVAPNMPFSQGIGQLADMPNIDRDRFGQVVWQDQNTPLPIRAATVGLVNTASMVNNASPFVSPWDIAAVTATGAARGLIVGKTLGALAGLKPESQQMAQRMGVWGGLLTAVVPNAFPSASQAFGSYMG